MWLFQRRLSLLAGWLGVAAFTGFVLVSPLAGQKPAAALPASSRPARSPATRPAAGGLRTGIRVHGRWTIVVRNPNGTVAAKREFENTLQLDGVNALPMLLGGVATPGAWGVYAGTSTSPSGPCGSSFLVPISTGGSATTIIGACVSVEASGAYFVGGIGLQGCAGMNGVYPCSPNLKAAVVDMSRVTLSNGNGTFPLAALQLQGALAVTAGGPLDSVGTFLVLCENSANGAFGVTDPASLTAAANLSPGECESGALVTNSNVLEGSSGVAQFLVTATSVPGGPITTVAGQTVQVTVQISFS